MQECTLYTSTAPCLRCALAILAIGVKRIAIGVSHEAFARLLPSRSDVLLLEEVVRRLELKDVQVLGPFLEEEGMRAFEHWGGEYHPLEELLEEARRKRENAVADQTRVCDLTGKD